MDEKDKAGVVETPREKRIDVSPAQVAGSALAAVVAAALAGRMGVYGTFIGAGVVSIVATTGGPVFQHFFRRTGEQIKDKKVQVPPRVRHVALRERGPGYEATALVTFDDPVEIPAAGPEGGDRTQSLLQGRRAVPGDPAATQAMRQPAADSTALMPAVDAAVARGEVAVAGRDVAGEGEDDPDDGQGLLRSGAGADQQEYSDSTVHGTRWRGWKRTLLPAALVFVLAVGGITVFELVSGSSVSGGKGTSIGQVVTPGGSSGSSGGDGPATTPSQDPDPSGDGSSSSEDQDGTAGTGEQPDPGTGADEDSGTSTEEGGGPATDPAPTSPDATGEAGTDSNGSESGSGSGGSGSDSGATEGTTGSGGDTGEDGTGTGEQLPESDGGQGDVTGSGELHPQPQQMLPGSG